MSFNLLPFEENGNILFRWWRNTIRPFVSLRSLWIETYRGDSILAPLKFAYLWILVACPFLYLAGSLGLKAIKTKLGPYVGLSLANTIQVLPGTLASFIARPLLIMFLGGFVAHGLLWLADQNARDRLRGTLRVLGYGCAWMLPFSSMLTAAILYWQINPIAAVEEGASLGIGMITAPSRMLMGFLILHTVISCTTFVLVVWGLASHHRIPIWKTFIVGVIAFASVWIADRALLLSANHWFIKVLLSSHEARRKDENTPKARIQRLTHLVEKIQKDTQKDFRQAGLPDPPRAVDLLTGGDWGAAIDLKQAMESGFEPSCQVIYTQTLSALKGQVIHFTACLGERSGTSFNSEPVPLIPPGSEAAARQISQNLTTGKREAISRARRAFSEAVRVVESEIGPFESVSKQVSPREEFQTPAPIQPPPATAPTVIPSSPTPPDPNTPSRHLAQHMTLAELRREASRGNPAAMNELGTRLYFGQNTYEKEFVAVDKSEGVRWLIKAYEGGFRSAESCGVVSVAYYDGKGAPIDHAASDEWSRRRELIVAARRRRNNP